MVWRHRAILKPCVIPKPTNPTFANSNATTQKTGKKFLILYRESTTKQIIENLQIVNQMNIDEIYHLVTLPKPKETHKPVPKMDKKQKKNLKNFLERFSTFGHPRARRDSNVTVVTVLSVK